MRKGDRIEPSSEIERAREILRAEVGRSSLSAVAAKVGIDRSTLYTFVKRNGVKKPKAKVLEPILEFVRAYVEDRLGPSGVGAPEARAEGTPPLPGRTELPPDVAKAARRLVDAFKREMALGGATSDELHYIETVLMTPNLPPVLAGGHVPPDRLLEHIQGLMEPIRSLLRDAGRRV